MLRRVIEGGMCVACLTFAAHGDAAAGMDIDVAGEKAARLAEGDMRFQGMVKIFGGDDVEMPRHMDAQRVGEFDLLARDRQLHGSSPELLGSWSKTPAKERLRRAFFPACAALSPVSATLPDIWPRSVGRCLCPLFAIELRWHRLTESAWGFSPAIRLCTRWRTISALCVSPLVAGQGRGEKEFQLENAARRGDRLVRGDAADRALMQVQFGGDVAQGEGAQMRNAVAEKAVLAADDFGGDAQDRLGAGFQGLHQPGRALQLFGQEGFRLARCAGRRGGRESRGGSAGAAWFPG